jgi:protein involved in polysaccharide export with SLBB domain
MAVKTIACILGFVGFFGSGALADMPTTRPTNEFYISGDVVRAGVWPIGDKPKSVLKAVEAAQLKDDKADYEITIIHRVGSGKLRRITTFTSLKELRTSPGEAADLASSDIVTVKRIKA